ncbi:nuclear pore complex protein Nup205 [Anabrus simplex]|uniref:nuclear pore complex protein Nup205 n=1 Tax=Anabrus simplex TaxID=316456 RepID=UPI0034DCF78C
MAKEPPKTEDMWTPFKELQTFVENVVSKPVKGTMRDLQETLRNHKQNFLTLLKNPARNAQHREDLRKGITEGITLPGVGHQLLSKQLVDEAIIISDMFDLNEYMALDLLCTAQDQMPFHPGLPRGLVAMILYYDGRKCLVCALRALVQARKGISWTLGAAPEIIEYITRYTQELMEQGAMNRVLALLETLDLTKEIELLQQNRGLGGPKHHWQVVELFNSIRQALADIVYCWAAQSGLPKDPTLRLIKLLKSLKVEDDPSGAIDSVTLTLQMALLYALDLSILQRRDDIEDAVKNLPLLTEPDFMNSLMKELIPSETNWECPGLQGMAQLAWALSLATLRMAPSNYQIISFTDEDELLVDAANERDVFDFMHSTFLQNECIYKEEFYIRRLHTLITDFIVHMPMKVKEMKSNADETSRTVQVYSQEGLEPPSSLPHHFEHLLLTVARLYKENNLSLDLRLEYWSPMESAPVELFPYRSPSRQASLFKFVRLGGDVLPPGLFVPYMKMLRSLAASPAAAKHAFNLLKQNGTGNSAAVSWTHFFKSFERYYSNLRQELPPSTDTVYHQHRNYPRGITPQEIQGLQAVLSVIRTVAEHDPVSRVALCDNPQWAPLTILLGLVSCSVPIPLKAELLLTLAALSMSPVTATTLWYNLEASQILATIPSTSSYQPRGVQTELEEIESRNEEYPLTRALLRLLDVLTNIPVPRLLGVGTRTPGFDPYLNFIVNSVFLRFNTRSYKHPEEKWEVAKSCLHLLCKLLMQYKPQASDFSVQRVELQGGGSYQVNPVPGYHIMVHLNSKTELLRLVLFLLDEGTHLLDSYAPFPGKKSLEAAILSCLTLLEQALSMQYKFFSLLSSSDSSLLLTGLNKLLLGMNPRSGKPDHLLNITKYVTYNSWLPEHALAAVRILLDVSLLPSAQNQLVGLFTSTSSLTLEIRHGFVECLEAESDDVPDEDPEKEEELGVVSKCKEAILKLLQQCLHNPAPNLSHYLLGFDLKKDIKKTVFQRPGVLGFPRTCLHSVLSLLDASIDARSAPYAESPKHYLLEASYCLLYMLCANVKTSQPVLRYLRACNDFLCRHLDCLPFRGSNQASQLSQMSWLLKTVAVEIRASASNQQFSQLSRLVNILMQEKSKLADKILNEAPEDAHMSQHLSRPQRLRGSMKVTRKSVLLILLDILDFHVAPVPQPEWQCFEPSRINELTGTCEVSACGNKKLIDVKKLHSLLVEDLASLQSSSAVAQRPLLLSEIENILKYAIRLNQHRATCNATVRYMDGWRQVTEIMFSVTPREVLPYDPRQLLLLDTLQLVLTKIQSEETMPEIASLASGVILLLVLNLRHCFIMKQKEAQYQADLSSSLEGALDATSSLYNNPHGLDKILSALLDWILNCGASSQKLRANLYAALLNFMQVALVGGTDKYRRDVSIMGSLYVSRLDSSEIRAPMAETSQSRQSCLEVLKGLGERLVDVLCHDCTGGHDVCKMLALSCLGMLIEYDPHSNWISHLSTCGYLKYLIDSLLDSDEKLIMLLEDVPATLSPLYVYEAKMAMLCRVASSHAGAEMLLEQGALGCLSSMTVYDRHPEVRASALNMDLDFIPSVGSRYLQIIFPALCLCNNILTSLGPDNLSCCIQIQHFLLSHNETVGMVLRCGNPLIQTKFLKELSLFTGLIARTTTKEMINTWKTTAVDTLAHVKRIHMLMLGLMPRFLVSESTIRDLTGHVSGTGLPAVPDNEEKVEAVLRFFQVACNLVQYVHNIIASKNLDHRATNVLFRAALGDSIAASMRGREFQHSGESVSPTLGIVVYQLVQSVAHYHREKANLDLLLRKQMSLASMNSTELKEFVPESAMSGNVQESRVEAAQNLESRISNKRQELKYCSYLIDNCLYIVWSHLDYYMLRALPKSCFGTPYNKDIVTGTILSTTETSWKTSADDISQLKQGLVSVFNDTFSKQLLETKQEKTASDKGFVEALVRRIKRLIQFVPVK